VSASLAAAERYLDIGRPDDALQALARLDPDTAATSHARILRGHAQLATGKPEAAAGTARDGLADDPAHVGLLYLLTRAEEAGGDLEAAERAILDALAQEPDDAALLCAYADVLMRGGQLGKAERVIDRAAHAEPDARCVLDARVTVAYLRGDKEAARRASEELLTADPEDLHGHRMLGVLDFEQGRNDRAAERLGEAVRQEPQHEPTARAARAARGMSGWWWFPARVMQRVPWAVIWLGAGATIYGLRGAGAGGVADVIAVVWVVWLIWSLTIMLAMKRRGW
jgi:predicted Zn-dependent protease